ncbi:DUF3164 family protein [Undibacterium sp.]|jgi:hypothetical protein|uniref:DUF3164 family protein n=1 Tax=Undibacterium sp. TaxID=1914977 RepID=UPI002D144E40|nr:DUF3164 family protein [Undibacterium sp.]HTD05874.1 DUF3164 family protein [Undibacterium sp.]
MEQITIPEGYMQNAQGHLVPTELVKPIDQMRHNLVLELVLGAKAVRDQLADFKDQVFKDFSAFVTLSAEQYDVALGGKKGNVTLFSYDGKYKVQLAISENIVFDERLQAAKALIDECISEWSVGSDPKIQVLVQDAFKTDKEGNINTGRVLGLRRLDIKDDKWKRAMDAIGESLQVVGSKQYIRFYERVGEDKYMPISLDIAAI